MKSKKKRQKGKSLSLTISQKDWLRLKQVAAKEGSTPAVTARRMIHNKLQDLNVELEIKNQLSLFTPLQTNIFQATDTEQKD